MTVGKPSSKKSRRGKEKKAKKSKHALEVPGPSGEEQTVPRSMIVRRGKSSKLAAELVRDLRQVMSPYTAERLKSSSSTPLKELTRAAAILKTSHLVMVSEAASHLTLRIARLPDGPTVSFAVSSFTLARHVRNELQRPATATHGTPPLLVANNFSKTTEARAKIVRATMEAMFATVDVATVKLADCRRVVLCHLIDDDTVDIRHYLVRADMAGVSKPVKDVVLAKTVPNLRDLDDVADYVLRKAPQQEGHKHHLILPAKYAGRGNAAHRTTAITLTEIGPRLTLHLAKIQAGVAQGDVLFLSSRNQAGS